ncbi:MAG: hypothetical protein WA324_05340, partial [Bryobacteraceae bacterium]
GLRNREGDRISRGTVDKWLRFSQCPPLRSKKAPRPGMAEYLSDELQRFWDQGCQNASKLLVEIRKLGYVGSYTSLCRFLHPWRDEKGAAKRIDIAATQPTQGNQSAASAMRAISAQEGAAALSKPKALLNERQSKIVEFFETDPGFRHNAAPDPELPQYSTPWHSVQPAALDRESGGSRHRSNL